MKIGSIVLSMRAVAFLAMPGQVQMARIVASALLLCTVPTAAREGWFTGTVRSVFVSERGGISVNLAPDPTDDGYGCRHGWVNVHSPLTDKAEARWAMGLMYDSFQEALGRNALVNVYLEDITASDGEVFCRAQRVQVQRPNPGVASGGSGGNSGTTEVDLGGGDGRGGSGGTTPQLFGALAVGDNLGGYIVTNSSSQPEADEAALSGCRTEDRNCRVAARFSNGECLAVARGTDSSGDGTLFWSWGHYAVEAVRSRALQGCRDHPYPQCTVLTSACNGP